MRGEHRCADNSRKSQSEKLAPRPGPGALLLLCTRSDVVVGVLEDVVRLLELDRDDLLAVRQAALPGRRRTRQPQQTLTAARWKPTAGAGAGPLLHGTARGRAAD